MYQRVFFRVWYGFYQKQLLKIMVLALNICWSAKGEVVIIRYNKGFSCEDSKYVVSARVYGMLTLFQG